MSTSCSSYFTSSEFVNVSMPLTTSADCEGAGEVFSLTHGPKPFYDRPAFLSVSGQLHLEAMAVGASLGRCWHLAPAFRAERSDTNRHLNEFWMCEAEMTFTDDLEQVMEIVEGLVRTIASNIVEQASLDLQDVFPSGLKVIEDLLDRREPWKRMTYISALRELQLAAEGDPQLFHHSVNSSHGLNSEHERWIAEKYGPTFITDYPVKQKPFYMRVNPTTSSVNENSSTQQPENTVACFDLLVPRIGELAGGSLREERLDILETAMREKGMKSEDYDWYLDLRRYGSVKHGGFGLGWERLISWLLGIENVRDCIAFPRGSEGSRF